MRTITINFMSSTTAFLKTFFPGGIQTRHKGVNKIVFF
jgi:hypothetical protein